MDRVDGLHADECCCRSCIAYSILFTKLIEAQEKHDLLIGYLHEGNLERKAARIALDKSKIDIANRWPYTSHQVTILEHRAWLIWNYRGFAHPLYHNYPMGDDPTSFLCRTLSTLKCRIRRWKSDPTPVHPSSNLKRRSSGYNHLHIDSDLSAFLGYKRVKFADILEQTDRRKWLYKRKDSRYIPGRYADSKGHGFHNTSNPYKGRHYSHATWDKEWIKTTCYQCSPPQTENMHPQELLTQSAPPSIPEASQWPLRNQTVPDEIWTNHPQEWQARADAPFLNRFRH